MDARSVSVVGSVDMMPQGRVRCASCRGAAPPRRLTGLLALLLLSVSELCAQSPSVPPDRSILVLLDVSYSMGIRMERSGQRRIDAGLRVVRELARQAAPREEWGLGVIEGRDTLELTDAFTLDPARGIDWRRQYEPDGSTPVGDALARAVGYLQAQGRGAEKRILIVSDGIATETRAFLLPDPEYFRGRMIPVTAVLCGVPDVESVQSGFRSFVLGTGGASFDAELLLSAGSYAAVLEALRQPDAPPAEAEPAAETTGSQSAPAAAWMPVVQERGAADGTSGVAGRAGRVRAAGYAAGAPAGLAIARVAVLAVNQSETVVERVVEVERREVSFKVIWLAVPLLALAVWRLSRRILALLRAMGAPRSSVSSRSLVKVELRSPGAGPSQMVLRPLPALVGASQRAELRLPARPGIRAKPDFQIVATAEGALFESPSPLNINGVGRTKKLLREGDTVAYDGHRVVFRGLSTERVVSKLPVPAVGLPWELVLLGGALLAGILLWDPITLRVPRRKVSRAPVTEVRRIEVPSLVLLTGAGGGRGGADPSGPGGSRRTPLVVARASAGAPAWSSLLVSEARQVTPEPPPARGGTVKDRPGIEVPLYAARPAPSNPVAVTVYAPGDRIAYAPVDALFVHAHPDDESIDFGVLIARLAAGGKRLAVVLLTDGEAGLDQYPDRQTGGSYAARDLKPAELGAVRPLEARNALADLGAATYVRLGLRNHPYASSRQVLTNDALMADWGEEALVSKLVELIEGFEPAVVVSPDSAHGGADEHFEHAGAGYLVREALRRVRERGRHAVRAYLRAVDPRFRGTYADVEGLDALETRADTGETFRAVQVRALQEHHTQRDATVVAVESLTSLRWEYYVAALEGQASTLDRFLRTW